MIQHFFELSSAGEVVRTSAMRVGKYKANGFGKQCTPVRPCVYNLEDDPFEMNDVYSQLPSDQVNNFISRMDETWKEAYAQPFFGFDEPSNDMATFERACKVFKASNLFLVPWATDEDVRLFEKREFSFRLTLSKVNHLAKEYPEYFDSHFDP